MRGTIFIQIKLKRIIKIYKGQKVTTIDELKYRLHVAKKYFKSDKVIYSNLKLPNKELFNKGELIKEFIPNDINQPGSHIRVYRIS